jgi:acyl-CoA hydrolase
VEERTVADSRSVLVHWMGPTDANSAGFVHGGVVMKLCDEVAGLSAVRHSHRRVVTAAADRMTFLLPLHIGELVTLTASVNAAWHSSMEVGIRVEAENPRTGDVRHTNTAYLTTTPDERRREAEAQLRRENRLAEREQILERRKAEA